MDCESVSSELVECARSGAEPGGSVQAHLSGCGECMERWDAERELSVHLGALRATVQPKGSEWTKAVLMREFDAQWKRQTRVRRVHRMSWMMSAAAAVILTVGVVSVVDQHRKPADVEVADPVREAVMPNYTPQAFQPAVDAGEKGFIAVPFATPLAQGELVRIVRTELQPSAVASMGISVDPGWTGDVPADLLVGQDGFPRAIRLSDDAGQQ